MESVRTIVLIWLAWVLIVLGFQSWAIARLQPARPDRVLEWTARETTATAQNDQPYLVSQPRGCTVTSWPRRWSFSQPAGPERGLRPRLEHPQHLVDGAIGGPVCLRYVGGIGCRMGIRSYVMSAFLKICRLA